MGSAVSLCTDYSASELRQLARTTNDARQSSRLLSLAAVLDGMNRGDAALVRGSANVRKSVFDGPIIWLLPSRLGVERISGVRRPAFG